MCRLVCILPHHHNCPWWVKIIYRSFFFHTTLLWNKRDFLQYFIVYCSYFMIVNIYEWLCKKKWLLLVFPLLSKFIILLYRIGWQNPASTPRGFNVETTWKRPFSSRFNVQSTWFVCRDSLFFILNVIEPVEYIVRVFPQIDISFL